MDYLLRRNYNQIPYIDELKKMGYKIILFDKNQEALQFYL